MVSTLLLTFVLHRHSAYRTPINGGTLWTQSIEDMAVKAKYHPMLRFNPQSTFMFVTPDFIMQGKYQVEDNHYWFRAITAFEIENADVDKLKADMNPDSALKFAQAYAHSMQDFQGDYNPNAGILYVTYPVEGMKRTFGLHSYTEGDQNRTSLMADADRGVAGLWQSPDPFPERLDARTRYRIGGLEGLQKFFSEAAQADGAQFVVIDLRVDNSYRWGSEIGTWHVDGRTVILRANGKELDLTIDDKGRLLAGGKPMFVRN